MLNISIQHKRPNFALDVKIEAPKGITVLFGRSGSGKTSIVNFVAGLARPDEARIVLGERVLTDTQSGVELPPHQRRLGYIFQEPRLFPHLNVQDNLRYAKRFLPKNSRPVDEARIVELLGIGDLLERRPLALSGGEKSRVAIGRALFAAPEMILADEPLASLDEARKAEILPLFEQLRDEFSTPMLYVSHSPQEVARLASTVVALQNGKVLRQGPAAEVLGDPEVLPLGAHDAGALLHAKLVAHHEDGLSELDAGGLSLFLPKISASLGEHLRVRIAAQDVMIARNKPDALSALNILPAKIAEIHLGQGPGAMLALDTEAGRVLARITQRSLGALELKIGDEVYAIVKTVSVSPSDIGRGY